MVHPDILKDSYLSKTYYVTYRYLGNIYISSHSDHVFFQDPSNNHQKHSSNHFLKELLESRPTTRQAAGGFWKGPPFC